MNFVIAYLMGGLVFWLFLHSFYSWEGSLSFAKKIKLSILTVLIWPFILGAILYVALRETMR